MPDGTDWIKMKGFFASLPFTFPSATFNKDFMNAEHSTWGFWSDQVLRLIICVNISIKWRSCERGDMANGDRKVNEKVFLKVVEMYVKLWNG